MGEWKLEKFQNLWPISQYNCGGDMKNKDQSWVINEEHDNCGSNIDAASSESSIHEDSTISNGSRSSNDTRDDACSSTTTSSSSSNSSGALYDLSELMAQLPIKRGLSKFYQGKSESFTCLSRVTSIEDLAKKKESPYRMKNNKGSKSFEGGLNTYKSFTHPKAIISKKTPRASISSSFPSRRGSFTCGSSRTPQIPLQKSLG
ncbi:hypothetical protein ACH5RR_024446 [Cinchona calisaya]|uniref:Oxidative stress 3 n=1 Tax=Cinchona calisaya TaxID=153742 RepID=A0ABD2YXW1_9GENT